MKKRIIDILAVLALLAGLCIGAVCQGILALMGGVALAWAGAVTLIGRNTDWLWNA